MTASGSIIRLFVSSTFADFAVERDVLQRTVFPRIRQLCAEQGFRFQPIDLRWGVSREAGNEKRTLTICFEEIRRCQQLSPDLNFLILLGDRYGSCFLPASIPSTQVTKLLPYLDPASRSLFDLAYPAAAYREDLNAVPEEYVLLPAPPGVRDEELLRLALGRAAHAADFSAEDILPFEASATHLEIQRGLLAAGADPAAVVCAVRTFAPAPSGSNAQPYMEHDPARQAQAKTLQASVEERLAGRVAHYTVRWDAKGPTVDRESLSAHLLALLESRVREVIAQRNQAAQGRDAVADANEHFAAERTAHFVGRADALAAIAHELNEPIGHPLVVTGASGAGKSTLLAEAARRAAAAHPHAVIASRYIGITPRTSSLRDLLVGLRREIAARYGQAAPTIPAEDAQLIAEFPASLTTATAERPLILIVDALDQLGAAPQRADWLPSDLPPHAHIVVSVLPDRPELATLRERLGAERIVRLTALARKEGAELLDHWLERAGRKLQPEQRGAVLASFAVEGLPLYLRLAFEQARRWRSFEAVPALSPTIPNLLRDLFGDLSQDHQHGPVLVTHALGDLGAAKNGLAEDEVLDLLGQDGLVGEDLHRLSPDSPRINAEHKLPLPVVLWARLYVDLEPYLTEREADGASLVTFYHRQLHEVVEEQYLYGEDGQARHRALAGYFGAQPLLIEATPNRRKLAEQAYQQARGKLRDELTCTLTDLGFLEQRIATSGTAGALVDLKLLPGDAAAEAVARSIRAGAVVLEEKPDELENQITGRVGALPALHDPLQSTGPHFRLLFQSQIPVEPALVRIFQGHARGVMACVFSPDGRLALSASQDRTLRLWDVDTSDTLRVLTGHGLEVNRCAFSPDGRLALSASDDFTLRLWDVTSGATIRRLSGHTGAVKGCAFSPDGHLALSASSDRTLRLWDVANCDTVRILSGHLDKVVGCAFTPDGRLALSASDDGTLRVWDIASGATVRRLEGHTSGVQGCAVSPDGRLALSASSDGTLRLWDVAMGKAVRVFKGHTEWVHSCTFSPDGRQALSASLDRTLRLWDVASGDTVQVLAGHTEPVWDCAWNRDGRHVLSASLDQTLRLWDVRERTTVRPFSGHTSAVHCCAFSRDGRLALSASLDRTLRLWDVATGKALRVLSGHTGAVNGCAFSPDGRFALSAAGSALDSDRTLRLWEVATGETVRVLAGHRLEVAACSFSPDGRFALSASGDRTLRLWDVATGETLRILEGHTEEVHCCAFSPDGRLALSASFDRTLRLWDVATGAILQVLEGHTDGVFSCTFSPDGRLILSAGDRSLRLWRVATGAQVRVMRGHEGTVAGCAFSPDGRQILLASNDRALRLWDMGSGAELARWLTDFALHCCAYGPDGQRVLTGDQNGGVHFLEVMGIEAVIAASPTADAAASETASYLMAAEDLLASGRQATAKRRLFIWWRRR